MKSWNKKMPFFVLVWVTQSQLWVFPSTAQVHLRQVTEFKCSAMPEDPLQEPPEAFTLFLR
jgi:hypothetical protein